MEGENKKRKKSLAKIIVDGLMQVAGSLIIMYGFSVLGDHYSVEKRTIGRVYEKIFPAEEGFAKHPGTIRVKTKLVNGKLQTYIEDLTTQKELRINYDLTTGTDTYMVKHLIVNNTIKKYEKIKKKLEERLRESGEEDYDPYIGNDSNTLKYMYR